MTDDMQDDQDWAKVKNFFNLKSTFIGASASAARSVHTPGKSAVVTAAAGIGGLMLGSLSLKSAIATGVFAVGTVLSFLTFNPLPVLALAAMTVASGTISAFAAKGAAWLLGAAKGAFLDAKYENHQAPQTAAATAPEAAASAGLTMKPAGNDFNRSADPATAAATTEVKPVQPEKPRDPGAPAP